MPRMFAVETVKLSFVSSGICHGLGVSTLRCAYCQG